ncbi:MAG TPA: protein kinase [Pyrinomonadaceae bacterium]|nr:protein kinase [Pyrinomonadaceae bacterium]
MPELKLQQTRLDGRYDILECLGRGSYAEIYVARDNEATEGAPTTIVIKALNMFLDDAPDSELEQTLIVNFQNEAVALDRVRHPNIISRLGHGTAIDLVGTTFHYIVLEYLSGGDMSALSRRSPLPFDKTLFYLEQVCSGLAHAHECGVIHRDIKPQNLLLTGDRQVVKIADFGVARFAASEGAITRVGTNIYSAPEHNPLVQTGSLDLGAIYAAGGSHHEHLTPAADIYSLAKTTYTLLAGEAPRKFAQHAIQELPAVISGEYWARPVLRVLEKATQIRPDKRYQTMQEFWDELADAALPPTQPLHAVNSDSRRRPSADLTLELEAVPAAPPQARFEPVRPAPGQEEIPDTKDFELPDTRRAVDRPDLRIDRQGLNWRTPAPAALRPKIVVPVSAIPKAGHAPEVGQRGPSAQERIAALPNVAKNGKVVGLPRRPVATRRARPFLVAAALVLGFSGMLMATHKYVTSRWNPFVGISQLGDIFVIGREGVTTTDVNLRSDANTLNPPVGVAEINSRVKILATDEDWYQVQVLEHGRPKTNPFTADRGWVHKKFVKFD